MANILLSRSVQLGLMLTGGRIDVFPPDQTLLLLKRKSKLSLVEADRLEAGLVHVKQQPGVQQRFMEAGGLVPLLERTIRPGADQLLEQAVGSCPPVMLPLGKGILVPRPVLLKAILVQVLSQIIFSRAALPSLRSAGRNEAVAGLARLSQGQEHELVQVVALRGLVSLIMCCSASLVAPLQQLMQQRTIFDACCGVLRAATAPPAGSLMEADASFLLEATGSAGGGALNCLNYLSGRAVNVPLAEPSAQLAAQALYDAEVLVNPALQAVWSTFTKHQAAIAAATAAAAAAAARPGPQPRPSMGEALYRVHQSAPLCTEAVVSLRACVSLVVAVLIRRRPDWEACRAVLPPRPLLEGVVRACHDGPLAGQRDEVMRLYARLLHCSRARGDEHLGQDICSMLEVMHEENMRGAATKESWKPQGLTQPLEKGAGQKDLPLEGWRSCAHCSQKETKELRMRVCSACRSAWFCSKECQTKAWPDHKAACKKLVAQAKGAGTSGATG